MLLHSDIHDTTKILIRLFDGDKMLSSVMIDKDDIAEVILK